MFKYNLKDYTESEFLELINDIINTVGTEQYQDELLERFVVTAGHPDGSDLIYYPDHQGNTTPERIVQIVKEWRLSQGLPCFKK